MSSADVPGIPDTVTGLGGWLDDRLGGESTLDISFDVRGGPLIRQIHHWAADLFMVAICAHMLRHFFLGSYRKPRDVTWLIGIVIFAVALVEGLFGYSLPDDQLSGAGLRIFHGVSQGVPIIGTYIGYFLFGGAYPGQDIVPRMYILHVFLLPGLILALVTAHVFLTFHLKHTGMPAPGNSERKVMGQPFWPFFMIKGTAWFFFIFAALALLATFAQPDWYLGILEGALRVMPAWEVNFLGHTLSLSVLIPFALPLGVILGGAASWPFFERWVTGDKAAHQINDRPRNVPTRTGIGVAVVVFYAVLWAEGANDVLANAFHVPLYTITWIARVLVIVGPVAAYLVTKRICLGLQRKDAETLEHGVETGIIRQLPNGGFVDCVRPATEEERTVLAAPPAAGRVLGPDADAVPAPGYADMLARLRSKLNDAFTETAWVTATVNVHAHCDHDLVDDQGQLSANQNHQEASTTSDPDRSA
jgi:ubiquinol-cytochrome c reductase cytochrome b subunit